MAATCRNNSNSIAGRAVRLCVSFVATIAATIVAAPTHAAQTGTLIDSAKEIVWNGNCELNIGDKNMQCRKVHIRQGDISIDAAKATATSLDFQSSKWTFQGDVHIKMPDGKLESESATVVFRDKQIANALIVGSPATFEQQLKEKSRLVHGRAGSIEYNVGQQTVQFDNQAWLSDGNNEITGRTFVYNIRDKRVIGAASQQEGADISIKIRPTNSAEHRSGTPADGASPAPTSEPAP